MGFSNHGSRGRDPSLTHVAQRNTNGLYGRAKISARKLILSSHDLAAPDLSRRVWRGRALDT